MAKTLVAPAGTQTGQDAGRAASRAAARALLAAAAAKLGQTETVALPELGEMPDGAGVLVLEFRSPTLGAQLEFEARGLEEVGEPDADGNIKRRATRHFAVAAVIATAHDAASGERMWADTEEDVAAVRALPVPVFNKLSAAALRVMMISQEAREAGKSDSAETAASAPA